MTRGEDQSKQDKCREDNDEATERMDYEGGNQGDDCSDREQRMKNRQHAGPEADPPKPGKDTPENSGSLGPWALRISSQHRERILSYPVVRKIDDNRPS
ncbi:MAG: hypothetical protein EOP56_04775 [Sphingobacteriales bacterium]|nr:MAG: hypothetical protein EOP56_04775 [Sphingobacteriales bacterium]